MSNGHQGLPPSREREAETYFKFWDDAAARLVRSVFLFGTGLLGLLLLPILAKVILQAASEPMSLAGFYQFSASALIALIFFAGSLGSLMWGAIVLLGAVNVAILAGHQEVPSSAGPLLSRVMRVFSKDRPFLSQALPAMSLGVILAVLMIAGIDASKDLIQGVLRELGMIAQ